MPEPPAPGEPTPPGGAVPHDAYAALRHSNYTRFLAGSFITLVARQMVTAAVTWQIYAWTKSTAALGLLGLLHAIPLFTLALPAGHLADRCDRRRILTVSLFAQTLLSALLAAVTAWHLAVPDLAILRAGNVALRTFAGWFERHDTTATGVTFDEPALPLVYGLLTALAITRVISNPARAAALPQLLPLRDFANAVTWNSSAFEIAAMAGPVLCGFVIAVWGAPVIYAFDAVAALAFALLLFRIRLRPAETPAIGTRDPRAWSAGVRFIWTRKIVLAAISLDLVAVLLGTVTALLPVFADRILGVGEIGFGWLRAAPAFGATAMAFTLAHRSPLRRPGFVLLWAVALYGVVLIGFGLSQWFWLSLLLLMLSGAADNISVVVRQSLVQLLTPDDKRGRVMAVAQIFIGSSNELGAFRAGLAAAWLGPVAAVVSGGIGTVLAVLGIAHRWPQLRTLAPLHRLRPE